MRARLSSLSVMVALNESPSEKEGKSEGWVPNPVWPHTLNESPSEKEGKCGKSGRDRRAPRTLNESPSEKEGKLRVTLWLRLVSPPQ